MFVSNIDAGELYVKLMSWDKWTTDGSGVLMSNAQSILDPRLLALARPAVSEIEDHLGMKAKYLMVNILPPDIVVPVHTDTLVNNFVSRWHLPVKTHEHAWFWDELNGFSHMELKYWHEVDYRTRHTIGNFGREQRVHLIVDLW